MEKTTEALFVSEDCQQLVYFLLRITFAPRLRSPQMSLELHTIPQAYCA